MPEKKLIEKLIFDLLGDSPRVRDTLHGQAGRSRESDVIGGEKGGWRRVR